MTVRYLPRSEWGAGPVTLGYHAPHAQFVGLVNHHTVIAYHGDPVAYMRTVQHSRPDLGDEVPYSFVIMPGATDGDCVVGEGRGWERTGAHTEGYNSTRYGVAWAGDYTNVEPTAGMLSGFRWLGSQLADPVNAVATLGHRDVKATACPGDCAYPHLPEMQPPFTALLTTAQVMEALMALEPTTPVTVSGQQYPLLSVLGWTLEGINFLRSAQPAGSPAAITQAQIEEALKHVLREGVG